MIKLNKKEMRYITHGQKVGTEGYQDISVISLIPYLNEIVELADDFTLYDLFEIIKKEKDIYEMIFACQLGHFQLQPFIEEIEKDVPENSEKDVDYLAVNQ